MTIQLNPEQEKLIGQAIQAGLIHKPGDALEVGIDAIRRRLELKAPMDADKWSKEFDAWVHGHPITSPLLSEEAISRDAIYGVRGM